MNFSEFRKKLGAEPRKTAEDLRDQIAQDPERAAASAEALAFEERLEGALRVPVQKDELLSGILAQSQRKHQQGPPRWLALAASVLLVVGISSVFLWPERGTRSVAEYVQTHYAHDGAAVLARARQEQSPDEVGAVLASLGVSATADLASRILYIKFCPTPDSQGAHMVMQTDQGPATVIFMPAVQLSEPLVLNFDGTRAEVVGLHAGAAAMIGVNESAMKDLEALLQQGLQPQKLDT